jgi:outer membrane protein OmpA-like peptidoglycan-associated protein
LPRIPKFQYRVSKPNYLQISGEIDIPEEQQNITKNFRLSKLEKEAVFELENVEFEFNKAVLTSRSLEILEPVLATMKENETLEIELSGHTDNIGSKQYNKKLSEARAQAVADYLIKNGIDQKRIKTIGYGFDKPIASNSTPEGRQKNRRTEMKILGIEYKEDSYEDLEKEFTQAEKKARVVKTISKDSAYTVTKTGIPSSLEAQFKTMIQQALAGNKQFSVKVDLFLNNGKIQSANVQDLLGNLDEETTEEIADMMLGWKVQSQGRDIYSFTVKK